MLLKYVMLCGVITLCLVGCSSPASTNPNDYVGEYLLQPANAVPEGFPDLLILRENHIAINVSFSKDSGQVLVVQKKWYLEHVTDEEVVIGDQAATRAYPINQVDSTIKLIISENGQCYEKIKISPK